MLIDNGQGVTQNFEEAVKWYRQAAAQGICSSTIQSRRCLLAMDKESHKTKKKQLNGGSTSSNTRMMLKHNVNLGNAYINGQGVTQNFEEAVKWYRQAATQGDAQAQYNLGNAYINGQGVTQNFEEAVQWWIDKQQHKELLKHNTI